MLDALTLFNPFDPILLDDSWYFALGYKEASLPLWKLKCPCWIWFLPCHAAYFYLDSLHWGSSDQTSSQMSSIPTAFWNCCLSSEYPRWCYCFLSLELTKWALNLGEKGFSTFLLGGCWLASIRNPKHLLLLLLKLFEFFLWTGLNLCVANDFFWWEYRVGFL